MTKVIQRTSDGEIIEAIKNGEKLEVFVGQLYEKHFNMISNFVRTNNGNHEDAEDLFQEAIVVFIDLVRKDRFRGDSSIKTFIYAISKNLWLNELKKRNRAVFRETEYYENTEKETENIKSGVSENEVRRQVFSILDKLGDNCKKILILFYYEEKSMRDIFQEMNYESEQVARNMKYKCMKKLHELLDANSHIKQSFKNLLVHG